MRRARFVNAGATDLTLSQRGRLLRRCPFRSANEDGSWELSRSVKTRERGTIAQICAIHPDVERRSLGQQPTPLRAGDRSRAPLLGHTRRVLLSQRAAVVSLRHNDLHLGLLSIKKKLLMGASECVRSRHYTTPARRCT